jgi:hypothetical protein
LTVQVLALFILGFLAQSNAAKANPYAPLWLYQGSWHVTRSGLAPGTKPDLLTNQCSLIGKYFACQQTVNGTAGALLIIIPTGQPGRYYMQTVLPEGRATGKSDLEISGDRWVFSNRWQEQPGKTVHYRTTNVFTGKNRIHFEQAESPDGTQWVVKASGEEVRVTSR